MIDSRDDGPFEEWTTLDATMKPLLGYIGRFFLSWSDADTRAPANGDSEFSVQLAGQAYVRPPQKYHAKSLAILRQKYRAVAGDPQLREVLAEADCLQFLKGGN